MSKAKKAEQKTDVENIAGVHVGQRVIVAGVTIEVPLTVEAKGPEAVQAFIEAACAKRGVELPKPKPASEPSAPAPTSSQE
jgi:hypothetical protein